MKKLFEWLKANWVGEVLVRRTPLVYGPLVKAFNHMASAPAATRQAFWQRRQNALLKAYRTTAWAKQHPPVATWQALPLLEKPTLRQHARAFFTPSKLPAPEAQTSGTTGTPLTLRRSWQAIIAEQAAIDWLSAQRKINLRKARVAVLRGDNIKPPSDLTPPFWKDKVGGRVRAFSANHLCTATILAYKQALEEFRPDVLWVYPSALESLCGLAAETELALPTLKLVLTSSEVLSAQARATAERVLGVPVYDYYGQAERVNFAYSLNGTDFYFHPAYGITELALVRQDDDADYYEIIGSGCWNTAQPLLRYKTGDLAKLPKGAPEADVAEIAMGIRPFLGIEGRIEDYLLSPDGVKLIGMNHIPRGIEGIVQTQLVQAAPDKVDIYVVPNSQYGKADETQLLKQARVKIPTSMKIKIHVVERIARNASGKAPLVVRKLKA